VSETPAPKKPRDSVPYWVMGALVLVTIGIVIYGPT
jgi:hypothetical protein